ncbi:alanine racemase [Candidatus Puniceispirillum sp.]|nr:alanine racemase [Candidatus Puniceispirillum sp.]
MAHQLFGYGDSSITVDLDAIVANWRYIDSLSSFKTKTAAMVKADGYGLGCSSIAIALANAGCKIFFVASLEEAINLKKTIQLRGLNDCSIMVLHGVQNNQEKDFFTHQLVPVLNDLEQISRWINFAKKIGTALPALLHFDTGMTRLGLDTKQANWLIQNKQDLDSLNVQYIMSHLVSAELVEDPINFKQLIQFKKLLRCFASLPASLANSAGTMLGNDFHFQMTRPGISLYGVHPCNKTINKLQPTFSWKARILQVRSAAIGDKVGYGGTFELQRESLIATIGIGYADGYSRQLSGKASILIGGQTVPVIGRISMDSITADVTELDQNSLLTDTAQLIHQDYGLERMALDLKTIPYEIMTNLGHRAKRHYYERV